MAGRPLSSFCQEDAETFFFWLRNNAKLSDDTKKDYWNMFRLFVEWLNPSLSVRKMKLRVRLKTKLPEDILNEEEVSRLIAAGQNVRERALISLTYHAALRAGEVKSLRIKDISFDRHGAVLIVPEAGKTGSRRIRIIEPVPLLAQYLQDHRFRDDPNAPLFHRMDKKTRTFLDHRSVNDIIKSAARRAGISKRVHTHLLRHSKATELAKKLTSQELMVYGGWKKLGTVQVYTHLSGADIEKKILEINGIKPDSEGQNPNILRPINCANCHSQNDSSSRFCSHCGVSIQQAPKPQEIVGFQEFLYEMFRRWKFQRL